MKKISGHIIEQYNAYRTTNNKGVLCHAPFTNINFAQNGNMTACCFNRSHVLGKYPHQSIHDAWYGKSAEELRDYIHNNDLGGGCKLCQLALESKNFSGSKAIYYDSYAETPLLQASKNFVQNFFSRHEKQVASPKVFEFELDNTCNLECVMCDGYFSSTIRSQREHLPAVKNPYDDNFVDQVAEFLPTVTDLKFLGGEPFLIEVYLKIWERVLKVNPSVKIHITTNGTVMNQRVKNLLEKLNCGIVVSMDSLDKDTYASIRKRGSLDKVLENLRYFKELTESKKTYLSIAVCPMRNNWHEMPSLVDFANERGISIHFNVVWNPSDVSLRFETPELLEQVSAVYSGYKPELKTAQQKMNFQNFTSLANQISFWLEERKQTWKLSRNYSSIFEKLAEDSAGLADPLSQKCALLILQQLSAAGSEQASAREALILLSKEVEPEQFIQAYFQSLLFILSRPDLRLGNLKSRFSKLESIALHLMDKATFVNDVIRNGAEAQIGYFLYEDIDLLEDTISARYSMNTAIQVLA